MFRDRLIHQVVFQRATVTYGQANETKLVWQNLAAVRGRLITKTEKIASTMGLVMATTTKLLVEADVDVSDVDRVGSILLEDGSTVGPFLIAEVLPRLGGDGVHHKALVLNKVKVAP